MQAPSPIVSGGSGASPGLRVLSRKSQMKNDPRRLHILLRPVAIRDQFHKACTIFCGNHPTFGIGIAAWMEAVAALREALLPYGWNRYDEKRLRLALRPSSSTAATSWRVSGSPWPERPHPWRDQMRPRHVPITGMSKSSSGRRCCPAAIRSLSSDPRFQRRAGRGCLRTAVLVVTAALRAYAIPCGGRGNCARAFSPTRLIIR